jgi:ADP-ribose pyrophosphatase YjhB (NUDIX family)
MSKDLKHRAARLLHPMVQRGRGALWRLIGAKSIGVRAIVLNDGGEILLVRHTYQPGWYTPGGGLRAGETPEGALRRELREEVGLELTGPPALFGIYLHEWRGLADYPILFVVRRFAGEARAADAAEIAEVGWFPLEALPRETTPRTLIRIEEFLDKRPRADRW